MFGKAQNDNAILFFNICRGFFLTVLRTGIKPCIVIKGRTDMLSRKARGRSQASMCT